MDISTHTNDILEIHTQTAFLRMLFACMRVFLIVLSAGMNSLVFKMTGIKIIFQGCDKVSKKKGLIGNKKY